MDRQNGRRLPLHPGIYGCLGCGVVVVALVGLSAYGVARALHEVHSEDVAGTGRTARALMLRVPGGILRGELVPADTATVQGQGWRDGHRVTFVRQRIPSFGEIMRISGGGTMMPFWDEDAMEEHSLRMASQFEARHISEYDVSTGKISELGELPENMFFGGGNIVWDAQGRRAVVLLRPLDALLDETGSASLGWYLFEPGGKAEWTLLVDVGAGEWGSGFPQWTPDGAEVVYNMAKDDDTPAWYVVNPGTQKVKRVGEGPVTGATWVRRDGKPILASGLIHKADDSWLGGVSYVALDGSEPTGLALTTDRGTKLGRLTSNEQVVSDYFIAEDGTPRTAVAVINLRTAEVRWIRDDLLGYWEADQTLLNGQAIVLMPITWWYNRPSEGGEDTPMGETSSDELAGDTDATAEKAETPTEQATSDDDAVDESAGDKDTTYEVDFDAPSECLDPCIISLIDGGFVSFRGVSHELVASPDGLRASVPMMRTANVLGLIPAPVDGLGLVEFIYPEELLTGGARQPADKDK